MHVMMIMILIVKMNELMDDFTKMINMIFDFFHESL